MAKIFIDTNFVLDVAYRKPEIRLKLDGHEVCLSIFSILILSYVNKIKIPNEQLDKFIDEYKVIELRNNLLKKSLIGPTNDIEDNIQLHSSAEEMCDIFLTNDKKLLKMKFFGKTRVVSTL